jgi:hypothetical protein
MRWYNDPMDALLFVSLVLIGSETGRNGRNGADSATSRAKHAAAESRAVAYLVDEVPRWSRENKCYSCHNDGDAARALYTAVRLGCSVPPKALRDTSGWLVRPQQWDHNGGESPFSDKKLARIQFAAALAEGVAAGCVKERQALLHAAELVAEHQEKDGSWQVDAPGTVGSPATYGACLATCQARRVLQIADPDRYRPAVAMADRWLRTVEVRSVLDAAAVLLALESSEGFDVRAQQSQCLKLIRKGEAKNGGWGPYVYSAPEPFDSAVVLLALCRYAGPEQVKPLIQRGRSYILSKQRADGSWPETTRPAGSESYAQRISTTAWALLALLATR